MILGQKINPMLFIKADSLERMFLDWEDVIASPKIDGIRMIVHKIGDKVILMSRTGNDVTHKFPSIVESVKKQFIKDFILDVEMVAIKGRKILPFNDAIAKFHGNERSGNGKPCLMVFDCLWFNEDITYLPFVDRFSHVLRGISRFSNLQIIPHMKMKDEMHIEELYRKTLSRGYEGLVLRDAYAPYEFDRTNSVRKIKPLHTIDLKIISKEEHSQYPTKYLLESQNGSNVIKVRDFRNFNIGDTVEIAYENVTTKGNFKFPRIIRLRDGIAD